MNNEHMMVKAIAEGFIGKVVNKVIAGGSTGSIIILEIGDNEYSLFVYCAWRLEMGSDIITGWREPNDAENGRLTIGIKSLMGETVTMVEIGSFFDLKIHFNSSKVLNIFCDVTPNVENEDYDDNWVLCDLRKNKSYSIKNSFSIAGGSYR